MADGEEAERLRLEGNKAFSAGQLEKAVTCYGWPLPWIRLCFCRESASTDPAAARPTFSIPEPNQ